MGSGAGPRGAATAPSCGANCAIAGSRAGTTSSGGGPSGAAAATPPPATENARCRRGACLLTTPDATLTRADRQVVDTLTTLSSEIRTAAETVNEFDRILRERDAAAFDLWLATTQATALRGFATGIINDIAAVRVALSQPGSNGPVEGQVNRLKMLKRQMYGRAKFDLLRSRVLHAA